MSAQDPTRLATQPGGSLGSLKISPVAKADVNLSV